VSLIDMRDLVGNGGGKMKAASPRMLVVLMI
jgi:hypothetical protein